MVERSKTAHMPISMLSSSLLPRSSSACTERACKEGSTDASEGIERFSFIDKSKSISSGEGESPYDASEFMAVM